MKAACNIALIILVVKASIGMFFTAFERVMHSPTSFIDRTPVSRLTTYSRLFSH